MYSLDAGLTTFLDSIQIGGDWQSTQTVHPSNLVASAPTIDTVELSWTPITYTADAGGYEVYYATSPGGPFTTFGRTGSKLVSSMTVTGLDPGTTYYFRVQTVTDPHIHNPNTVYSNSTTEIVQSETTLTPLVIESSQLPYGLVGSAYSYALDSFRRSGDLYLDLDSFSSWAWADFERRRRHQRIADCWRELPHNRSGH